MTTDSQLANDSNKKYSPITQQFAIILKRLREENNMTQHELVNSSGLSLRMISDMERGIRQPTLITLFKLSKGLNISILALIERLLKEMGE